MAIVSLCVQVKARYIYLAGATFTIIARFCMKNFFIFMFLEIFHRKLPLTWSFSSVSEHIRFYWSGCNNGYNGFSTYLVSVEAIFWNTKKFVEYIFFWRNSLTVILSSKKDSCTVAVSFRRIFITRKISIGIWFIHVFSGFVECILSRFESFQFFSKMFSSIYFQVIVHS